jgi:DinB superfamily
MPLTPMRALLDRLSVSPVRLRALLTSLSESALRTAPPAGGFAPIEDAWHLRDIEVEGHFPRIRRILAEESPVLASIDGDRLALERQYRQRELGAALDEFAQYREASLGLLGALAEEAWSRRAIFQDRSVSLRELVVAMAEHDESHLNALAAESDESTMREDSFATAPASPGRAAVGLALARFYDGWRRQYALHPLERFCQGGKTARE